MWESLDFLGSNLLIFSLWFTIPCLILGFIQMMLLVRKGGTRLKRGFKIYGRPLKIEEREFIQSLHEDIFTQEEAFFGPLDLGFIRQNNHEILVWANSLDWRSSWPSVGYIDLMQPNLELQYRIPLLMYLALLPFVLSGIGLLFIGPLIYMNFRHQMTTIDEYLQSLINKPTKIDETNL